MNRQDDVGIKTAPRAFCCSVIRKQNWLAETVSDFTNLGSTIFTNGQAVCDHKRSVDQVRKATLEPQNNFGGRAENSLKTTLRKPSAIARTVLLNICKIRSSLGWWHLDLEISDK